MSKVVIIISNVQKLTRAKNTEITENETPLRLATPSTLVPSPCNPNEMRPRPYCSKPFSASEYNPSRNPVCNHLHNTTPFQHLRSSCQPLLDSFCVRTPPMTIPYPTTLYLFLLDTIVWPVSPHPLSTISCIYHYMHLLHYPIHIVCRLSLSNVE